MEDENEDAQQQWNNLQKAIGKSTEKIPITKKKKKQPWMTEDIFEIMDKRRKVKSKDEEKYREYNRQIHRECRKAKEKWMNDRCIEIEELAKVNQGQMYDKINQILYRNKDRTKNNLVMDTEGNLLMEMDDILKRWTEDIKELYEDEQEVMDLELDEQGPEIMKEEIRAAMNRMKKGKAIGKDGIAVEIPESLGEKGLEIIKEVANKIYKTRIVPEQLIEKVIITIPKVAGKLKCEQYRTINIINHMAKIILRVVIERMRSKIRPEIS